MRTRSLSRLLLILLAGALLAFVPDAAAAFRQTSYQHVCGGDIDQSCCTQPNPDPSTGFCDPSQECILYVGSVHYCQVRPFPTPPFPAGQCGGNVNVE